MPASASVVVSPASRSSTIKVAVFAPAPTFGTKKAVPVAEMRDGRVTVTVSVASSLPTQPVALTPFPGLT